MVQAVERAIGLLERLDEAGAAGLPLRELAAGAGLKAPTARNLLATLVALGYVEQDPLSRRYVLGARAQALGRRRSVPAALIRAGGEVLAELQQSVNETVILAHYRDGRRHTLLTAESDHALRVGATEGVDDHFYHTATGRMLLAALPAAEREAALDRLGPPGHRWPEARDRAAVATQLAAIRERGYACYRSPDGQVVALAVPLPIGDLDVNAALGLHLPAARHSPQREGELLTALREAAARIAAAYERTTP